ncbi:glycosyltransferase family 9 protein [Maribacter sp. 2308TA10-17]|uniref:glycosyltransferase family 9 protein n=1 Tax=Maribacter sp. 2308TA10-17 TaxID=3386276 RepID=UPI0039BC5B82
MPGKKFLIIQQKMIGDVLTSTVICEKLKNIYPDCIIHFVANENTLAVLEHNPNIDRITVFEKKYKTSKKAFYIFLKSLRRESYDTVIDAYGKLESNLMSLFSRAEYKIALEKWYTRWIYSHTIKENLVPQHNIPLAIQNRLNLLSPILKETNSDIYFPKIYLTAAEIQNAKNEVTALKTSPEEKFIMISILGSSPMKTYPAEYMAEVLDTIASHTNAKILFNYIPNQREEAFVIYEKCKAVTQKQIEINFYANSLRDFLSLLSQCSVLIGNEGGAVNMAKALHMPTFCIFSPFILKGAWHSDSSQLHKSVHLRDFKPDTLKNVDKNYIKKNIQNLYADFEPALFQDSLVEFLNHHAN